MSARSLFTIGLLFTAAVLAAPASAQTFYMKDGREVTAKSLRRQGDTIMATVQLAPAQDGQQAQTGELGYPIAQISKIDFPDPPQLAAATDLIIRGKISEAFLQLDPVIHYYEGFRDAPGSWWMDAAVLKVLAQLADGRDKDASALIDSISRTATEPDAVAYAKALAALNVARHGDPAIAMEMCKPVIKDGVRPEALAVAYLAEGESHLARKEWEQALMDFLKIPVFYPDEKLFLPQSMIGSCRAYTGLQDFARAKTTLTDLTTTYAGSREAQQAKVELEKVEKAERLAALQKAPN